MYTVQKGDTLAKIAKSFGVSVADLLAWNPEIKDPNLIKVGQQIRVSAPEEKYVVLQDFEAFKAGLGSWQAQTDAFVANLAGRISVLEHPPAPVEPEPDPDPDPDSDPEPDEDWPDEFMSYDLSSPISLSGQSNVTIEGYSFEGLAYPQRPITLTNCDNITIRRIDSRRCSQGLVYAVNCNDITIEYCRAENITGPYERVGANRANFYQFNNVDGFDCHHFKGRYGDTEDVFSHYNSRNGTLTDVAWEGAVRADQPTTDGSESIRWRSNSGTGAICGDGNGSNVIVKRATFLNPGQVGIAIAGGQNCGFEDCVVISTQWPDNKPNGGSGNVAAYVWDQYNSSCQGHHMTGNRTKFHNNNNFWNGNNCGAIVTSGSVWGDNTLNAEDYRVIL